MALTDKDITTIGKLLAYSFAPIEWKWEGLTASEKEIIKDQATLARLRALSENS